MSAALRVVHEGRGGYIDLDGHRYPIEHVESGHFCVHFVGAPRALRAAHLAALEAFVRADPERWALAVRGRR